MEAMYQEVGRFICRGIMVAFCDQLHQLIACINVQMKPVSVIFNFIHTLVFCRFIKTVPNAVNDI